MQNVKQVPVRPSAFPKNSTILFRKNTSFSTRENFHAVRASDLLRFGGRPPYFGSADARQELQHELQHEFPTGKNERSARFRLLPCLSAGGRRLMDATAVSGNGFKAAAAEIRIEERGRANALSA